MHTRTLTSFSKLLLAMLLIFDRSCATRKGGGSAKRLLKMCKAEHPCAEDRWCTVHPQARPSGRSPGGVIGI